MTTYDKCKAVRNHILARAAAVMNYPWDDEFSAKQIRETHEKAGKDYATLDITKLTASQMEDLGFGKWSKNDPMWLIPLWLYQWLPEVMETKCIDGTVEVLRKAKMDTDHRFGYLAYGIYPSAAPEVES